MSDLSPSLIIRRIDDIVRSKCGDREDEINKIKLLLAEKNANINRPHSCTGWTVLASASLWGRLDLVKLFIEYVADVNARNKLGGTPLHAAAVGGCYPEVVKVLIENGADVNAQRNDRRTASSFAKDTEIKNLLINAGAGL